MARRSSMSTWLILGVAAAAAYYFREKLKPLYEKVTGMFAKKPAA